MREHAETLQNILQSASASQKAGQAGQARAHYGEIIKRAPTSIQATAARICLAFMDHNEKLVPLPQPIETKSPITVTTVKPSLTMLPVIFVLQMGVTLFLYLAL